MTNTNEIRVENSTKCSNQCSFCPNKDGLDRGWNIMDMDLFQIVFDRIKEEKQIDTIIYSGLGEPLADPTILEKTKMAIDAGYKTQILTNGYYLTKEITDELINMGLDTLRVSFHHIIPDKFIELTKLGLNDYYRILNNIMYLIDYKKDTRVVITSDMIERNNSEIELLKIHFHDADLLEIWQPHNWTYWGDYREGTDRKLTCGRPANGPFQVQVDGTMNMCCFDYNGELTIGDLRTHSIREIYEGDFFKEILSNHENGMIVENNFLPCNKCDQLLEQKGVVYYNSGFTEEDRVFKTSTIYDQVKHI